METQNLVQGLQAWNPAELEWQFALYSTRRGRDGLELEINACKMRGISGFVGSLKTTLLEKTLTERSPMAYTPFLGKENIGTLERNNEFIRDALDEILVNTHGAAEYAPEDFVSGVFPAPKGYILYGYKADADGFPAEQVLLMKRSNPFLSGGKTRLCTTEADTIVDSLKPLLKFPSTVDFLLFRDSCYFLSPAIEKDLGLESRQILLCQRRLALLAEAEIVSDYEQLEQAALKSARKFLDFDTDILAYIMRLSLVEREEFLLTYGIRIDGQGRMDTGDAEQCGLVIDLLCCRSCLDPLGRLATGNNITPR